MRTLKGAVKLTALFINRAADLASISTARNSFTLSQPEESMRPVHKMVLTRIMPNSVTSSHIWTKHMFSRFGNLMGPIENLAQEFERVLVGQQKLSTLNAGTFKLCKLKCTTSDLAVLIVNPFLLVYAAYDTRLVHTLNKRSNM